MADSGSPGVSRTPTTGATAAERQRSPRRHGTEGITIQTVLRIRDMLSPKPPATLPSLVEPSYSPSVCRSSVDFGGDSTGETPHKLMCQEEAVAAFQHILTEAHELQQKAMIIWTLLMGAASPSLHSSPYVAPQPSTPSQPRTLTRYSSTSLYSPIRRAADPPSVQEGPHQGDAFRTIIAHALLQGNFELVIAMYDTIRSAEFQTLTESKRITLELIPIPSLLATLEIGGLDPFIQKLRQYAAMPAKTTAVNRSDLEKILDLFTAATDKDHEVSERATVRLLIQEATQLYATESAVQQQEAAQHLQVMQEQITLQKAGLAAQQRSITVLQQQLAQQQHEADLAAQQQRTQQQHEADLAAQRQADLAAQQQLAQQQHEADLAAQRQANLAAQQALQEAEGRIKAQTSQILLLEETALREAYRIFNWDFEKPPIIPLIGTNEPFDQWRLSDAIATTYDLLQKTYLINDIYRALENIYKRDLGRLKDIVQHCIEGTKADSRYNTNSKIDTEAAKKFIQILGRIPNSDIKKTVIQGIITSHLNKPQQQTEKPLLVAPAPQSPQQSQTNLTNWLVLIAENPKDIPEFQIENSQIEKLAPIVDAVEYSSGKVIDIDSSPQGPQTWVKYLQKLCLQHTKKHYGISRYPQL